MNIRLIIPPAMDWNMPLMALPLLKSYLPSHWDARVIDVNAKFLSLSYGSGRLKELKEAFVSALSKRQLLNSVDICLQIEDFIAHKQVGSTILHGRNITTIPDWYNSNQVYKYINSEQEITKCLSNILIGCVGDPKPEIFALSVSIEEQIVPSFLLSSIIRLQYPNSKIIWGGNIVSRLCDNLISSRLEYLFDLLVTGEGEPIIKDAIDYVLTNDKVSNKVFVRTNTNQSDTFESLLIPDYSDISWSDYLSPVKILPITAQRKCKWSKCDFCAIHSCWTYGVRDRKVYDVVDEIEYLNNKYGVSYFRFVDEMTSSDYLFELSQLLIERGIQIRYEAYVRFEVNFTNRRVVETIYKGGCRQLFWGLENINNDALKYMTKGTSRELITNCLNISNLAGITNYCFVLTGIPHIPTSTEVETLDYVRTNEDIHVAVMGSFVIDRLSPIHVDPEMHKKYGISIFEIGDLTTEVGYTIEGKDIRNESKERTAKYISDMLNDRPDYALTALLSEESRMVLSDCFGNQFAHEYIGASSLSSIERLVNKAKEMLIEERVLRRIEGE